MNLQNGSYEMVGLLQFVEVTPSQALSIVPRAGKFPIRCVPKVSVNLCRSTLELDNFQPPKFSTPSSSNLQAASGERKNVVALLRLCGELRSLAKID